MSLYVTAECVCCSACVGECPREAIEVTDQAHIDPERCDGCATSPTGTKCQPVCPVECIVFSAERAA